MCNGHAKDQRLAPDGPWNRLIEKMGPAQSLWHFDRANQWHLLARWGRPHQLLHPFPSLVNNHHIDAPNPLQQQPGQLMGPDQGSTR